MSKVKHFLRKLHIGDHHQHGRPPALVPPSQTAPSQQLTSTSPLSDAPPTASSSSSGGHSSNSNFSFFEEEFQMQLALAISVSDPGQNCVDPETAQINVAKQISLGCAPSQNLSEFMSLRFWSCNVVNYDEKVIDGFYDVCGIDSTLAVPKKMPSLMELKAISPLEDMGCEVVLVNRADDVELRKLEERVYYMSVESHALDKTLSTSFLIQKIADLIVERMGGPVSDVEEMFRRWRARNHELRVYLNSVILPLGSLDVGHSRQRALLFKVLADKVNLPCKLVKGSYYTGTDEGAVNLIKLEDGSEYIIDLMGAPGTLIPTEIPSAHHQNFELDARSIGTSPGSLKSTVSDQGALNKSIPPGMNERPKPSTSSAGPSVVSVHSNVRGRRSAGIILTEHLEHNVKDLYLPPKGSSREDQVSSTRNNSREGQVLERNELVIRDRVDDQCHAIQCSVNEHSLIPPPTGQQLLNISCDSGRKHSAEGLRADMFKLGSAGHKSSLDNPWEQNLPMDDRNDEVISTVEAGFGRDVDASGNNVQIDPVLNGVAEILWEDLQIGERIGIGSYGEVYRAEWNGTEVAVKKFMKQDISGDALAQFKCEIEIMLRLRHPNVVLFMGAVTRPPHMSILTEFLPRGSLYKLLHRPNIQIDEKRRIKMALDVAKGMNYLHTSHPIIVHRDLKTPNLLVDKNWAVKVCDFGMSRLQHHTFLSSKSAAGTAEWMAPEVLRNEPSNEKSDVYSFGVILWELATLRVPWTEMNSMQVVGAVGFQGRHLDIPPTVDPLVAEIISDCWNRNPQARPSFAQIITRLKCLQRLSVRRTESCKYQE
ncbi:serine/threonine-protein kinase EDR1-like [Salvia miltiorrhiza]|uniref:serine/threonine-protein kinase EDR1-like n=1 Tax=Salvia miltiorrhiza TaxID=226208 RepID=UPI0025AC1418|nr:serine/threonine-protein kinase EDR1-like [Salvia miltiorrhiza]